MLTGDNFWGQRRSGTFLWKNGL